MKFELNDFHLNVPDEELLADVRRVAQSLSKNSITGPEYKKHGKYSLSTLEKRFGWIKCLEAAGLETTGRKKNADEESLFKNLEEVWTKLGRQPVYQDMHAPLSRFSGKPYKIRFGSWRKALEAFVKFVNQNSSETSTDIPSKTPTSKAISTPKQKIITHKTSRDINWRMRFLVMRRDNFKCKICGRRQEDGVRLEPDHILAWAEGGETTFDNLQTLCSVCNIGKSDLDMHNQ